jgi:hypothetical protein
MPTTTPMCDDALLLPERRLNGLGKGWRGNYLFDLLLGDPAVRVLVHPVW